MKVLIVEDDTETAAFVVANLADAGHLVDHAASGQAGYHLATAGLYDVIVLDRMLPEIDGITLVKAIRSAAIATPVLFLTNLSGIDDRVDGLEAGGDDYLVKPFAIAELLARLTALARRPQFAGGSGCFTVADLQMDLIRRIVRRAGETIDLLPREFQLLDYLMRSQGRIVTRTMLLEQVWNFHFDPKTNIVETHISRLRAKIDRGRPVALIQTLRGVGYALREP